MQDFMSCFENYVQVAEFINYIFVIVGVIIAVFSLKNACAQLKANNIQLNLNTEAQQDLLSPRLILSYNGDKIGGSYVENVGNLFATNITIKVTSTCSSPPLNDYEIKISKIDAGAKEPLRSWLPPNCDTNSIQSINIVIFYDSPLKDRSRQYREEVKRNG